MTRFYKLTILPLLCFISSIGMAQINLDLQWEKQRVIQNGDTSFIQNCSYCLLDKNNKPSIIYTVTEAIDSLWIENVKSEFLLGYKTADYSPLQLTTETILSGKQTITNIHLPAYYTENGKVKKIKSVKIGHHTYNTLKNNYKRRIKKSVIYVSESKLKNGAWFKLAVNKDGIYKLDAAYLSSLGINLGAINANKIKIYGSGNAMLPQQNDLPRPDDLVENAIYVSSTNSFGVDDYVLFYGQSPHKTIIDTTNKLLSHTKNIYTESSYYFLTTDGDDGLRIGTLNNNGTATKTITTSDAYTFREIDKYNALNSGRSWYAENFDTQNTHSFPIETPDKVNNSNFRYQSAVMAQAYASGVVFSTTINGAGIGSQNITKNAVSSKNYGVTGYNNVSDFNLNYSSFGNSSSLGVTVAFSGDGNSSREDGLQTHGFFNYAGVQYKRNLTTSSSQVVFRNFESLDQEFTKYQLGVSSSYRVWNITNPLSPLQVTLSGTSFVEQGSTLNQYILFNSSNFLTPHSTTPLSNQNLHGITSVPNIVIITHNEVMGWAQEYASYRNSKGLSTLITTPQEIYNEFSSGAQDVSAIRDFLKMLYDKDPTNFKYVTLFGGASYDYKNRITNNTNHVPIYESEESLHNVQTFSSDDYYGFLTDGDGEWAETNAGNHQMVVSVGRLLARTTTEAEILINKIKHYENSPETYGDWRSYVTLLADDGDGNLHVKDADKLSKVIHQNAPGMKVNKVYLDNYEQSLKENGWEIAPAFDKERKRVTTNGTLIVNYTGHGAPFQLSGSSMLTVPQVDAMTNYNKLPIYVTATCDVGKYDNPETTSSIVMNLLYNTKGGAIATVSTTRPVYASSNFLINKAFYNNAFERKEDSTYRTLGESFMHTKNTSTSGVNNRNFSLLGDPCLKLSLPDNKLILTEMNQDMITNDRDTLKALTKVTFKGKVTDGLENTLTSFYGKLNVTIYDQESGKITLGSVDQPFNYSEYANYLFNGEVSVSNGLFQITFIVPKDISYQYAFGKITMYASNNQKTTDAIGYYTNLVIGGNNSSATPNDKGPSATLFMDDDSFISGDKTRETTLFIADLYDENGINTTSTGIGHEITLEVDGDKDNTIILNPFYKTNLNEYQYGKVKYQLKNMKKGRHHLKFTAWDTHNNPVTEELEFVVDDNVDFYTYPNPFSDETTLHIDHNNGEKVNVQVTITNDKGQQVLTENYAYEEDNSIIDNITWDGTFNGSKARSGVYFVQVNLHYPSGQTTITKIHKVVLLH